MGDPLIAALRTAADEIAGWGAGNEAGVVRQAATEIERLRAALAYAQEKAEARIAARERRRAVEWLHKRADSMNDPNARAILHSAATNLGWANAREAKETTNG